MVEGDGSRSGSRSESESYLLLEVRHSKRGNNDKNNPTAGTISHKAKDMVKSTPHAGCCAARILHDAPAMPEPFGGPCPACKDPVPQIAGKQNIQMPVQISLSSIRPPQTIALIAH